MLGSSPHEGAIHRPNAAHSSAPQRFDKAKNAKHHANRARRCKIIANQSKVNKMKFEINVLEN
jgi:hypothetical protein